MGKGGEAWYLNPKDSTAYSLGRTPEEAIAVLTKLGVGISEGDVAKIQIGLPAVAGQDTDKDGIGNAVEAAAGTNAHAADTDGDKVDDKREIAGGRDPLKGGTARMPLNRTFANKQKGRIFIRVQGNRSLWYIGPTDAKRYFVGSAENIYSVIKQLGKSMTEKEFARL
jgi:hypothetical protein